MKAEVIPWSELIIRGAGNQVVLLGHPNQRLVKIEHVGPNCNYAFPDEPGRRYLETASLPGGKIRQSYLIYDNEYACVITEDT